MSKPKFYLSELATLISHEKVPGLPVFGVSIDSRAFQKGEIFFALGGANTDGHAFLQEVAAKGCVAAVVSRAYAGPDHGLVLIRVDDTLQALQELARKILSSRHQKIVAITGSLGKTTTKEFAAGLLKHKFRVSASPGNSNSQIGLPLAILNHTDGTEDVLVLEMGMTHAGQLKGLVQIAPPDMALITTTALVHACNFEGLADIGRAKAEIFTHPMTKLGILDRNIENFDELCRTGTCRKLSFGVGSKDADYSLEVDGERLTIKEPEGIFKLDKLPLPGRHNLHNFLGAVAVARKMGMRWEEINAAIPSLNLPERRLQMVEKNGAMFVNDSYNASAVSLKAALESLPPPKKGGKRIAVIGEMLELGKFSEACHREVGVFALKHVDRMLCFGKECEAINDEWKKAGRPVEHYMDRADVVKALRLILQPGDVVLLKGSRAKGLWKVLEEL